MWKLPMFVVWWLFTCLLLIIDMVCCEVDCDSLLRWIICLAYGCNAMSLGGTDISDDLFA